MSQSTQSLLPNYHLLSSPQNFSQQADDFDILLSQQDHKKLNQKVKRIDKENQFLQEEIIKYLSKIQSLQSKIQLKNKIHKQTVKQLTLDIMKLSLLVFQSNDNKQQIIELKQVLSVNVKQLNQLKKQYIMLENAYNTLAVTVQNKDHINIHNDSRKLNKQTTCCNVLVQDNQYNLFQISIQGKIDNTIKTFNIYQNKNIQSQKQISLLKSQLQQITQINRKIMQQDQQICQELGKICDFSYMMLNDLRQIQKIIKLNCDKDYNNVQKLEQYKLQTKHNQTKHNQNKHNQTKHNQTKHNHYPNQPQMILTQHEQISSSHQQEPFTQTTIYNSYSDLLIVTSNLKQISNIQSSIVNHITQTNYKYSQLQQTFFNSQLNVSKVIQYRLNQLQQQQQDIIKDKNLLFEQFENIIQAYHKVIDQEYTKQYKKRFFNV